MPFEAALRSAAHSEPRAIVRITERVSLRAGSGLLADPQAVTAPEMTPRVGGSSVKGRVKS